ncbi:restriction endonuclease [Kitasatospora sp. NPDC008050]|uniref:restriction endonuclease n=1 Tax=Kitasatospora sp. NPDC008050 TaxID=3364021 RepID=UPI0036EBBAB0
MTDEIEQIYDEAVAEEKLKSGTKYERLTAIVFKALDASNAVVHDVTLRGVGKEASHQIDVQLTYGAEQRRILIECKNYGPKKIGIGIVRDFNGALLHLQPVQGIVVGSSEFTSGARKYARDESIVLAQLRPFTDDDWSGRVRKLSVTAQAWVKDEPKLTFQNTGNLVQCPTCLPESTGRVSVHEASYYDRAGTVQGLLSSLLAGWNDEYGRLIVGEPGSTYSGSVAFPAPIWLVAGENLVEVDGFQWETIVLGETSTFIVDSGNRIAELVLRLVDLPVGASLPDFIASGLTPSGSLIFRDQLTQWAVVDSVIEART